MGLTLDRYHIDAAYVAWRAGRTGVATFDLFSRRAPFDGAYMLVAGVEEAIHYASAFAFAPDDVGYVASIGDYEEAFLRYLGSVRFEGEIAAMPEGTVAFGDEPIVRVTAPFVEALLLESAFLHYVSLGTLIATKAARVVHAAAGRPVAEFALRRAQDPATVTRSAWIAGVASTSYLGAAHRFGLPATGTIPHALVQAFETEHEAFAAVAGALPRYTLLLDTYDVHRAIGTAIEVARARPDHELVAVRLDSGDMAADARFCRAALDEVGLGAVRILASGDLDEFRVEELVASGAPIDAFGVGTSIGGGTGSPEQGVPGGHLNSVYKLVSYDGRPTIKEAVEKATWPGHKQVWRVGAFDHDVIGLSDEPAPSGGKALLGAIDASRPERDRLAAARERARAQLEALPEPYKALTKPAVYPVERSSRLVELRRAAAEQ